MMITLISLFAMMAAVNGQSSTTVTCTATGITVVRGNVDHTTSSTGTATATSGTCSVTATAAAAKGEITLTIPFAQADCFSTGVTLAAGASTVVTTNNIYFNIVPGITYSADVVQTAQCTYDFTDKTGTTSFTGTAKSATSETGTGTIAPSIEIVSEKDGATVATYDFTSIVDKVCVKVTSATTVASDINIKGLIFSSDGTFTDPADIGYIVDYCPVATVPIHALMDAIVPTTTCATSGKPVNCPGTRVLCFKPFYFGTTAALHLQVIVTPESTAGFHSGVTCAPDAAANFGRKKRDTELDMDEYTGTAVLYFKQGDIERVAAPKTCETEIYVIGLVVLSAAFVLTAIAAVFSFSLHFKNNNKALA